MAKLNIPKRFREGVFKISQLDDRTVQEIRRVLDTVFTSPHGPTKAAISAVASLSQTNKADFVQIAEALAALYGVKAGADASVEEFVDDICDAMQSVEEVNLRVPEALRGRFRERLTHTSNRGRVHTRIQGYRFADGRRAYFLSRTNPDRFASSLWLQN